MNKRWIIVGAIAVVLLGLLVYSQQSTEPFHVSGFVEADEIRIGSRVGGRVEKVLVEEGALVSRDQVLMTLQPFDLDARKAEAEAQLAQSQVELERLQNGYREEEVAQARANVRRLEAKVDRLVEGPLPEEKEAARARLAMARAQVEEAQGSYDRIRAVRITGSVTQEEVDQALEKLKVTKATQQVRAQELKLLERGTREEEIREAKEELAAATEDWRRLKNGFRYEEIQKARAAVDVAKAALKAIETQREELAIRAPMEARVDALELQPGDLVSPNAPVLSLISTSRTWVRAYVPEDRLDLREGQRVWITADSFPGRSFAGELTFVASQAEFTPNNVQTPEERSRQVYRIKVTVREGKDLLRPGMAADVWLTKP